MNEWWRYENLESGAPYDWSPATKGDHEDDQIDFHLDLGCGTLKKGRLGIDRFNSPTVDIKTNLNKLNWLPFPDNSIESIISHHVLEHIGDGFIHLMDECYRVLKPGGIFRIIVPCFPSFSAVDDPDHVRYFTPRTFDSFIHDASEDEPFWTESFSVPYTSARFKSRALDYTPPESFPPRFYNQSDGTEIVDDFSIDDLFKEPREIRVSLQK